jgi:hypothetical protein
MYYPPLSTCEREVEIPVWTSCQAPHYVVSAPSFTSVKEKRMRHRWVSLIYI